MNIVITIISNGAIVHQYVPDNAEILRTGVNEGVTWIRGWHKHDSKEAAALLVANALGQTTMNIRFDDSTPTVALRGRSFTITEDGVLQGLPVAPSALDIYAPIKS